MPALSNRLRIQTSLIGLAKAGRFFQVTYDPNTGLPQQIDAFVKQSTPPATVLCNEINAEFSPDTKNGRTHARQRDTWNFQLLLGFNAEVTLEFFEAACIFPNLINLPRDDANGLDQVFLELVSTNVQHPVTQGAAGGTNATLIFTARKHR